MSWLAQLDLGKFLLFTLVLTRVSGLMLTAPIYGTRDVPMQVRGLLAVALAVLITPTQWHVAVKDPGSTLNYLVLMGSELLIGACLGLGIEILFSGIQLVGQMIGRISGEMLAEVFDPNMDESFPVLSQLLSLVSLAIFVCIGGHRIVMAGLLDTFQSIPPGNAGVPDSIAEAFVLLVTQSFTLAVQAAAPVVTALLLATLVLGFIGRTLPQLNVMALGFGMNSMLTLAVLSLSLGATAWVFQGQVEPALENLLSALHLPVHSELLL